MSNPSGQELKAFANALQLGVESKIVDVVCEDDRVLIKFERRPSSRDEKLYHFLSLLDGHWKREKGKEKSFIIRNLNDFDWPKLTLFLLLTRLNADSIMKLADLDSSSREIAEKLGFKTASKGVEKTQDITRLVFDALAEKKMTMRELSRMTGLTQVTISNFKAGGDIKLSNLLKIINVLQIRLFVK